MSQKHPTQEHLAGYASGALSEGMSLLIAAHNTYCPKCRADVERFETLSSALMMEEPAPVATSSPSLEAAMRALDAPICTRPIAEDPLGIVPMPIRAELDGPLDSLGWKFRLPGLHEYTFDGFDGEHVSLMRIRPGTGVLHHTHEGEEATLILSGQMEDQGVRYGRGDVALNDHNDNHKPRVVGDEICYCLIVMSGNLKFTGPVGRALNLFTR